MASKLNRALTDHNDIRRWAEERRARPASVSGTGRGGDAGVIRLDFPGFSGKDKLQEITWDDWFSSFDRNKLALIVQDRTAGGQKSNFNKLVRRDRSERPSGSRSSGSKRRGGRAKAKTKTGRARAARTGGRARATARGGRTRRAAPSRGRATSSRGSSRAKSTSRASRSRTSTKSRGRTATKARSSRSSASRSRSKSRRR